MSYIRGKPLALIKRVPLPIVNKACVNKAFLSPPKIIDYWSLRKYSVCRSRRQYVLAGSTTWVFIISHYQLRSCGAIVPLSSVPLLIIPPPLNALHAFFGKKTNIELHLITTHDFLLSARPPAILFQHFFPHYLYSRNSTWFESFSLTAWRLQFVYDSVLCGIYFCNARNIGIIAMQSHLRLWALIIFSTLLFSACWNGGGGRWRRKSGKQWR